MWKLYAKENYGIAVMTRFKRLRVGSRSLCGRSQSATAWMSAYASQTWPMSRLGAHKIGF